MAVIDEQRLFAGMLPLVLRETHSYNDSIGYHVIATAVTTLPIIVIHCASHALSVGCDIT